MNNSVLLGINERANSEYYKRCNGASDGKVVFANNLVSLGNLNEEARREIDLYPLGVILGDELAQEVTQSISNINNVNSVNVQMNR